MKKLLSLFFILILLSCYNTPLINVEYLDKNFELEEVLSATVGSLMIQVESGTRAQGQDPTKELTQIQKDFIPALHNGFSQELYYSGKSGNTINITYREYMIESGKKLIRDSYSEKLNYDIGDSKLIAFRSLKMEVIEANSNEITFKVIEWGNN